MTRGLIIFATGFAFSAAAGWLVLPDKFYSKTQQPVQFSHEVHVGPKNSLACDTCHSFRADGSFTGVPKMDGCTGCHAAPMGTTVAEKNFIEQYVTPGREPQWLVYSRQPDNASFSHAVHVKRAKLACEQCHSTHAKTTTLRPVELNRISGYARDTMHMDACVACHKKNGLEHSCLDCHK